MCFAFSNYFSSSKVASRELAELGAVSCVQQILVNEWLVYGHGRGTRLFRNQQLARLLQCYSLAALQKLHLPVRQ
jgi:hypothetical protein